MRSATDTGVGAPPLPGPSVCGCVLCCLFCCVFVVDDDGGCVRGGADGGGGDMIRGVGAGGVIYFPYYTSTTRSKR